MNLNAMKKTPIALLCLLFLSIVACDKHPLSISPQEDMLYQVEAFLSHNPDSATQILDTLDITTLSDKEKAHYCLMKVRVRDAKFLYDNETDSLLQVAEKYFVGSNEKYFEALTCEALSRVAFKKGQGEQVKLNWLQKAYQSMEQCKSMDKRLVRLGNAQEDIDVYKNKLLMRLGMCYVDNDYFTEGLNCLRPAAIYFEKRQRPAMLQTSSAFMLGTAYLQLKEYDSCRIWYEKCFHVAEESNDTGNIAYFHYSMASYYRHRFDDKNYENDDEGEQLLRQAVTECHQGLSLYEGKLFKYKDGLYDELGRLYYMLEQYDSCMFYSEKRLEFLEQIHFKIIPNKVNSGNYYRLYKSYEALGDKDNALKCAHHYIEMQQNMEDNPQAVERVKNDYEKNLEILRLQHEQRVKRYQLYLLLALAAGALLVVLWLTNRYRKNKEIEMLRQEETYRKLQSDFDAASQLSKQALQQRTMALYNSKQEDKLECIIQEFSAAYPGALERMQSEHPELIEAERHIVVLSFLGFRVKEEAELLGLSTNTVTKYRTNIRKKTNYNSVLSLSYQT